MEAASANCVLHDRLFNQIGRAFLQAERWQEAGDSFRKSLETEPDNPVALDGLASIHLAKGEWENAVEKSLQAVGLVHFFPEAHFHLAVGLERCGQTREAIAAYETALGWAICRQCCIDIVRGTLSAQSISRNPTSTSLPASAWPDPTFTARISNPNCPVSRLRTPSPFEELHHNCLRPAAFWHQSDDADARRGRHAGSSTDGQRAADQNNPRSYFGNSKLSNTPARRSFMARPCRRQSGQGGAFAHPKSAT